jgi:hypothetical protein
MQLIKKAVVYDDAKFDGTIKTRGIGFFLITKVLITLSVLLTIFMLIQK